MRPYNFKVWAVPTEQVSTEKGSDCGGKRNRSHGQPRIQGR